ncbi:unnamed protein product [Paramecium sonneborni]|uniref:Uncharacterized protein n=1 Tax=Paramecium sonneborni TaxID=65129 RepID=A0A8S1R2F8_9CILI|nr:unnamed protein product [Paramecium sonneborni]
MKNRPQSAIVKLKSEPSDPRSSFSHLLVIPKANRPLHTPQQFHIDQETLYINNMHQKQETNEIKFQNLKLKTLVQQLQARISQIEKVDKHQLLIDPLGMSTNNTEGCIVPMLKAKIKKQAQIIEELTTDLRNQCKSVKLTSILELQKQIKNQQDEILKLRQFQQLALKITDQDLFNDPDIAERIQNYIKTIEAQQIHIDQLFKQNKKLNSEYQELLKQSNKLQEECKQISIERTQFKKKLDEQIITETEQYQQKKREFLEKKLQSVLKQVDSLKGELSLYETKYKQSTRIQQDQEREFKQTLMNAQKANIHLEELLQKKEQLMQDLQDRVAIYDLLKQKSTIEEPIVKLVPQPPKTYRDQYIQFPEPLILQHKPTDIINANPIDQERLQQLLEDLKYKVISLCLTQQRLQFIFKDIKFMQLKDSLQYFMRSPFNYQQQDALILSRHFFSEDKGTGFKIQWEDTQNINDLIQLIIPKKEDIQFNFKTIINRHNIIKQLYSVIKNLKLNDIKYNIDDYMIQIKRNTNLNDEQITFLRLINQMYLGDVTNIDQGFLRLYLKEECEMISQLYKLQKIDFVIYRYIPKLYIKQEDNEFEQIDLKQKISEPKIEDTSLTFSLLRMNDSYLKTSESRKPTSARDTLTYSQSQTESIPLKMKQNDNQSRNIPSVYREQQIQEIKEEEEFVEFQTSNQFMMQPPQLLKNQEPFQKTEEDYKEIYSEEL